MIGLCQLNAFLCPLNSGYWAVVIQETRKNNASSTLHSHPQWEDVSEDKDKSITKQTLTAGVKFDKPNEGAVVEVAIKGVHSNDIVFDERELKFTIGEGTYANTVFLLRQ